MKYHKYSNFDYFRPIKKIINKKENNILIKIFSYQVLKIIKVILIKE